MVDNSINYICTTRKSAIDYYWLLVIIIIIIIDIIIIIIIIIYHTVPRHYSSLTPESRTMNSGNKELNLQG